MEFGDPELPDKFWQKVFPEPNTGCWLWAGPTSEHGYGYFRQKRVHRLTKRAPVDKTVVVDHLCHVRSCVNPAHLDLVSHSENTRRAGKNMGVGQRSKTHCPQGHLYSEENTYQHTQVSRITGELCPRRRCKTCTQEQNRASNRRVKNGLR